MALNRNTLDHLNRQIAASEALVAAGGAPAEHDERVAALNAYYGTVDEPTNLGHGSERYVGKWVATLPGQVQAFRRKRGLV